MNHRKTSGAFNPEKFLAQETKKRLETRMGRNPLRRFIVLSSSFKEKIYRVLISQHTNWKTWSFGDIEAFFLSELREVKIRVGKDVFGMLLQDFWEYIADRSIERSKPGAPTSDS